MNMRKIEFCLIFILFFSGCGRVGNSEIELVETYKSNLNWMASSLGEIDDSRLNAGVSGAYLAGVVSVIDYSVEKDLALQEEFVCRVRKEMDSLKFENLDVVAQSLYVSAKERYKSYAVRNKYKCDNKDRLESIRERVKERRLGDRK